MLQKTIFQTISKYTKAELMKCELGHSDIFEGVRSCSSTITALNTIAVINSLKDPQVSPTVLDAINQYNSKDQAIQNSEAFVAGQVSMVAKGSSIIIRTCVKLGCATSDKITSTIVVD